MGDRALGYCGLQLEFIPSSNITVILQLLIHYLRMVYSDLFSDLTQPIGRSQELRNLWTIAEANAVPVQVTVSHESFGVGAIQERSDNWSWGTYTFLQYRESLSNMESDVLSVVKVSRHTFWST